MEGTGQSPHRRWNPLRQSWVLVSPHRTQRPWQGEVGVKAAPSAVPYDPECYLCPGNQRAGGAVNPAYESVFSFVNDYAALLPELPVETFAPASPLLLAEPARGLCKVLCYHPDHSLTLARMTSKEIRLVVDAWTREYLELAALGWIKYVQIFENRGAMMAPATSSPRARSGPQISSPTKRPLKRRPRAITLRAPATACSATRLKPNKPRASVSSLRMNISRPWFRGGPCGPLK